MKLYLEPFTLIAILLIVGGAVAGGYGVSNMLSDATGTTLEQRCDARQNRLSGYDTILADPQIDKQTRAVVEGLRRTVQLELAQFCPATA